MLPFFLVSLLVSGALAVPVSVTQYNINELSPPVDNGRPGYAIVGALENCIDGGDTNIYILTLEQILADLGNQADSYSHALAIGQTISVLGELATGVPGDSCAAAALVNAYADRVRTGNTAGLRSALNNYVRRTIDNIDLIVRLANDPDSVRYSTGSRGNCAGGGRRYQFEAAWDAILNNAGPYQIGLVNEQYCAAKRLYSAFNNRSNNVGAAVSAAAVVPYTRVVQRALGPLLAFLRVVASGGNPSNLAASAKQALIVGSADCPL